MITDITVAFALPFLQGSGYPLTSKWFEAMLSPLIPSVQLILGRRAETERRAGSS